MPALRRQRQEHHCEFEASLSCTSLHFRQRDRVKKRPQCSCPVGIPDGSLQRRKGGRKGEQDKTEGFLEEAVSEAHLKADCLSNSWVVAF